MKKILFYLVLVLACFCGNAGAGGSNDLQAICQLTLDMSSLDKYFHVDKLPERKPLLILINKHTITEPSLFKFGEKVRYISKKKIKGKSRPYLEFSKIEISENSAYVEFLYPPEGIAGKVNFVKDALGWHIKNHSIVER